MPARKLAVLSSHPIPYFAPFLRELTRRNEVELMTFFGHTYGAAPQPSGWGLREFSWSSGVVEGYPHVFLANWSPRSDPSTFAGKLNPGLLPALYRFRPNAILVTGYASAYHLQAILAGTLLRAKLIYLSDSASRPPPAGFRGNAKRAVLLRLFRRMAAFLAVGESNRCHYRSYGVPDRRIFPFPYAVDNAHFLREAERLVPQRARLREALGVPSNATCVLFSGRLWPEKNVEELIEGAHGVSGLHVLIVGSGPEQGRLTELARRALPGRHTFMGFLNQDRLGEAYAAADLLALTSKRDAWGLVCNEAMNFGLPLVLSDQVGAAADLVTPGVTGWTYPAGDLSALRAALTAARDALQERREQIAAAVRARVAPFDASAQVDGLMKALDAALGGAG